MASPACTNQTLISVIIPAYNAAKWIGETLDSVLAQTYPALEVLVVDDGSTDATAEVVRGYGERVRLIEKPNGGHASARNLGIRLAQGEYVAFVDADDLWNPRKLELQVNCLQQQGVAWVICGADHFEDSTQQIIKGYDSPIHAGDVLEALFQENFIASPTPLIRKSIFAEVGDFDESYPAAADWDMWLRIAVRYPLGAVNQKLALRRLHPGSITDVVKSQERMRCLVSIADHAVARSPRRLGRYRDRMLARLAFHQAIVMTKKRQFAEARSLLLQSLRLWPFIPQAWAYAVLLLPGERFANLVYSKLKPQKR